MMEKMIRAAGSFLFPAALFIFAGLLIILPGSVCAQGEPVNIDQILNVYNSSSSKLNQLHTYTEMVAELNRIAGISKGRIVVGPLVKSDGSGLLPVDETLMTNIINTVPPIPGLRNTIARFGSSTMGRPIMAARAGNPAGGRRVLIISQQHGNEVTSTEAVLNFLQYLAVANDGDARKIRRETDILFIVRANPDGGEPDPDRCLMADETPFWGNPFALLPDGTRAYDCALQRYTVDNRSSYFMAYPPVLPGSLFGAPFIGYDPNRYHYALLDRPIYPVETQAMVYALRTFMPEFMLDLHNQNIKIRCNAEQGCTDPLQGEIIDGAVQAGSVSIPPTDPDVQTRAERMGAHLLSALNRNIGTFGRFAQVSATLPPTARASVDAAMELGIVANWLEVKCNSEVVAYAALQNGQQSMSMMLGMPFMPSNLQQLVGFHEIGMREYLLGVADGVGDITTDNGGYDTNPAWDPPDYDLFIVSDQLSSTLANYGITLDPVLITEIQ